jgi:hypothetical protein
MAGKEIETDGIENRMRAVEERLSRIEAVLKVQAGNPNLINYNEIVPEPTMPGEVELIDDEEGLESTIGRFGLAWMGNIVLFFGITFLDQYLSNKGQPLISALIGYSSAISIFLLSRFLKKSNESLAFLFKINGQLLLFYTTIRLHFFSASPLIGQKYITITLLLLIIGYQVYWAIRNKSQALSAISVIFILTTAIITDSTHLMLSLVTITAMVSVYYFFRFKWQPLVFVTIILTYVSFFMWIFGNPLMGHPMAMISDHHNGIAYLFLLGGCYSSILLFRQKESYSDDFYVGVTFTNGIIFTLLLFLTVLKFFSNDYVSLFGIITICCLLFSVLLHARSEWNFAAAFYALYGFMAMSIALYGLFGFPKVYLLLSFQSLVVVTMALWFRNRLIVVMNSLLFLAILLVYFVSSKPVDSVNFSFAIISLVSARVINWQRSRLEIKTDFLRNLYLFEGFVMVMLALYHAIPKHLITLSWIMAALLYFVLSFILKNIKYRYMALGTMICAALYLFIVDLAQIELIYRVLALLVLSAISIGISMYYFSRVKKI